MSLEPGTRLGPYEIEGPLGAGGMGEVYRARDTRLDRTVAVKVLPPHLCADPDVRARFEREARAASSLNHPNICTLFDIGSEDGVDYLVMEYLQGETLAQRLEKGPLPLRELIEVGGEIAAALDRAHRQGLVHRDLKPANVMLTRSGAKLMDFGLAKAAGPVAASPMTSAPTQTTPLTAEGAILGTIQYMSPEQLEGKEADARSDLFAFGAVLYETATGRRPFDGASQASVIASILKEEPRPIADLVPLSPPALERLVRACLAKDADARMQSAHDVGVQLRWLAEAEDGGPEPVRPPARRRGRALTIALALLAIAGWGTAVWLGRPAPAPREIRLSIPAPHGTVFAGTSDATFAVSPDGTRVAFTVVEDVEDSSLIRDVVESRESSIWVRDLADDESLPLTGTDRGGQPFWSPDGGSVAFATGNVLKRVPSTGGTPQTITTFDGNFQGGTWGSAGTILFGVSGAGIQSVPEDGGRPTPVTTPADGERGHRAPQFLPDGRHFLFLNARVDPEQRAIFLGSLDGGEPREVVKSRYPGVWVQPDSLLHIRGATMLVQPLRLDPPGITGDPRVVVDEVGVAAVPGQAAFAASPSGVVVYRRPDKQTIRTRLTWVDRDGRARRPVGEESAAVSVSLSPDGIRAAVDRLAGTRGDSAGGSPPTNLWEIDLDRGVETRLTTDSGCSDENPIWSPDGRWIAYASHDHGADAQLLIRSARGSGPARALEVSGRNPHPTDWSPDGKTLLLHVTGPDGHLDIATIPAAGGEMVVLADDPFNEAQGQFSPDGRWIAYSSLASGTEEVYVRSYPEGDQLWQVSSKGGVQPRWRADGRELYYVAPDGMLMAVDVRTDPEFHAAAPAPLFSMRIFQDSYFFYGGAMNYAPSRDGQRFLVNEVLSKPSWGPLRVVMNWQR